MDRAKALSVSVGNTLAFVALGVCYARLLQASISFLARHVPQVLTSPEKMAVTGTAAFVSIGVIFAFNRVVTRQSMRAVGLSGGLFAYLHFYIIKPWPSPYAAVLALHASYSLFALLAFTFAPVLVGLWWHARLPLSGFHLLRAPAG